MEALISFFLHFDLHLNELVSAFGPWVYLILFLIIFAETGLVVTPILPGDSLLFTLGALASTGSLNVVWLIVLLVTAAILGDSVNYTLGKYFSEAILNKKLGRFIKKEHLERTHNFYEKYGGKTIVLARFIPIIRTFAPFVAGIGKMSYGKFAVYNIFGGILWVNLTVLAGFYFGNIPVVKNNFSLVVFAIIGISLIPVVIGFVQHRSYKKECKKEQNRSDAVTDKIIEEN